MLERDYTAAQHELETALREFIGNALLGVPQSDGPCLSSFLAVTPEGETKVSYISVNAFGSSHDEALGKFKAEWNRLVPADMSQVFWRIKPEADVQWDHKEQRWWFGCYARLGWIPVMAEVEDA